MEYRLLGRTGLSVSKLCFGTMTFGGPADRSESQAIYRRCRDAGINLFDCANNYNAGRSEEILGELIRDERDEVIISSKFTFRRRDGINNIGSSRRQAMLEVEGSLKRLGTDWIDIYFVHCFDPAVNMEETLRALEDLVRQGKVLYIGVSNWAAWQIAKALGRAWHYGWNPINVIQPMYSLLKRQAESELLPLAESEGIGVMSYSPLAGGMLTGKYLGRSTIEQGRFADMPRYQLRYPEDAHREAIEGFLAYARKLEVDPVSLAIAWVSANPAISSAIIGARNRDQLSASLAAADLSINPDTYRELAALSKAPAPATDRSEEVLDPSSRLRGE